MGHGDHSVMLCVWLLLCHLIVTAFPPRRFGAQCARRTLRRATLSGEDRVQEVAQQPLDKATPCRDAEGARVSCSRAALAEVEGRQPLGVLSSVSVGGTLLPYLGDRRLQDVPLWPLL